MLVGDIIDLNGERWLVTRANENLNTAMAERSSAVGITTTVLDLDADDKGLCVVVCNPVADWPSVMLPPKRGCELVSVEWGATRLTPIQDWVKLDPFQIGGLVYINPALSLGFKDRLTAIFRVRSNGVRVSKPFEIPRFFESFSNKQARHVQKVVVQPEPVRPSLYTVITDKDDDEL